MNESSDPKPFLTAEWRNLAMLHYVVPREALEPWLPAGTTIDTFQGKAYASVVGFQFLNSKLLGLTVPFHRNFVEANLRFYVRRPAGDEWRRGVVFIKEIVAKAVVAKLARELYNEPYEAMPMWHRLELGTGPDAQEHRAAYGWRRGDARGEMVLSATGPATETGAGTLEEFLTDLHWGYNKQKDGTTMEYHVAHPRWTHRKASAAKFECDIVAFYGPEWSPYLSGPPACAHLLDGSAVTVYHGRRV